MTKARCGWVIGILVGGQRKLIIFRWHWTLFRQRSDTSYDRSWPGVQRRRQVWVQTIIDTLWICSKIDLFIWKILWCEVLTNLIKTGFWKWGRAQCLEDQWDTKWWVYTLVVPSGTYISLLLSVMVAVVGWWYSSQALPSFPAAGNLKAFVFLWRWNSCLLSSSPFLAINHEC